MIEMHAVNPQRPWGNVHVWFEAKGYLLVKQSETVTGAVAILSGCEHSILPCPKRCMEVTHKPDRWPNMLCGSGCSRYHACSLCLSKVWQSVHLIEIPRDHELGVSRHSLSALQHHTAVWHVSTAAVACEHRMSVRCSPCMGLRMLSSHALIIVKVAGYRLYKLIMLALS